MPIGTTSGTLPASPVNSTTQVHVPTAPQDLLPSHTTRLPVGYVLLDKHHALVLPA